MTVPYEARPDDPARPATAELQALTHSPTAVLQPSMKPPRYEDEATVRSLLRSMDDWRLDDTYAEGLRERAAGGPADGDTARSAWLLTLIAAEMDRRMYLPWQGPIDPPGREAS